MNDTPELVIPIQDPVLRAAFLTAYRAWRRHAQQLSLFDEAAA